MGRNKCEISRSNKSEASNKGSSWLRFRHGPLVGIAYAIAGSFFITLSSALIKKLSSFDPWQQNLLSGVWLLVGNLPLVVFTRQSLLLQRKYRLLVPLRALLSVIGVYFSTLAFRFLPMAEASIIVSATPGVAALAARVFLKEPCGLVQSCALVFTIIGCLLAVRLPELLKEQTAARLSVVYLPGIACAVGYVVFISLGFVMMRVMQDVHFSVHMMYLGTVGAIGSACLTAAFSVELPCCGADTVLMMSSGFSAFVGYCFVTLALQTEAVAVATLVRSASDVVVALVLHVAFFRQHLDIYSLSGAAIAIICATAVGLGKWLRQLPEEAALRKRLKFSIAVITISLPYSAGAEEVW